MSAMAEAHAGIHQTTRTSGPNRCHHCNGRFGLVRHRLAHRQFCSKACVAQYRADSAREASRFTAWTHFLTGK